MIQGILNRIMQKQEEPENWTILKNYKFSDKNLLGKGAFAEVYLGKEIPTGKEVAIKRILKKRIDYEPKLVQGMKTEIEIMKNKGGNEHLLSLYHFEETANYYHLVIELCKSDLGKVIKTMKQHLLGKNCANYMPTSQPCIPEEVAGLLFVQLILGLHTLHSKNVLHRDLKPENLLLLTNPLEKGASQPMWDQTVLKLADFGFSRNLDTNTLLAATVCGTPLYMSPELMNQVKYGPKSDIWSCGCILYEMLTGIPPFLASENLLAQKISSGSVYYPPYMSPDLQQMIYGMLRKNPGNRFDLQQVMKEPFFVKYFKIYQIKLKMNFDDKVSPSADVPKTTSTSPRTKPQQQQHPQPPPQQQIHPPPIFPQVGTNQTQQLCPGYYPQQQPQMYPGIFPQNFQQPQMYSPMFPQNFQQPAMQFEHQVIQHPNEDMQPQIVSPPSSKEKGNSETKEKPVISNENVSQPSNEVVEATKRIEEMLEHQKLTDSNLVRIEEDLQKLSEQERLTTEKKKYLQEDISHTLEK